jgi:dipeptidyl aminopeptidase/acylaminoacyl peptidase
MLFLLALSLATVVRAQAQLSPEQVTRLRTVGAVAISPDARFVAYTLTQPRAPEEDTVAGQRAYSELWIVPVAGGAPRAIVQRPASAGAPAWSPDGTKLGYSVRGQIHVVPAEGGTPIPLTTSGTVNSFQWAPDGQSIAYTSPVAVPTAVAERRRRGDDVDVASERSRPVRLWVQPAAGGQARALTSETQTVRDFAWAPDSRTLAVQITETSDADADLMDRRIYRVTTDGRAAELLVPTEGKLGPMAWSPDGTRLAFLGAVSLNDPLAQSVFVVPAAGGKPVNLTPDYEGSALWVGWQDARTVRFVAAEGTKTALNTVPAAGGARTRVAGTGAEIFFAASFARDGATFAVAASTAHHPNDVFTGSTRTPQLRRLTNHNEWLSGVTLGRQETVEYVARDGWRIQGVLVHAVGVPQGTRAPLAVLPHGGPEGTSYDNWTTNPLYPAQVLAGAGFAVFMPNYRGSGGRGVAFSKGDHRDLGGREFDDVLDGISHLHGTGVIDSTRVGISGTSYGGFFSAWAGTRHSARFRLAMPFAGLSNWMSFTGTTDIPREMSIVHWDLWPYEHPLLMWERSPIAHVADAQTPMVIGQGLADERVHPEQMIELHQALRLKGVPVELVLYPREPHGLLERQHQLDYMRRILDAFNKYVKPARVAT